MRLEDLYAHKTPGDSPVISFGWRDIRKCELWDGEDEEVRPARQLWQAVYLLYDGIDPGEPEAEVIIVAETYDGEEGTWHGVTCYPKVVPRFDSWKP